MRGYIYTILVLLLMYHSHAILHNISPATLKLYGGRNFTEGTNPHLADIYEGRCYAVFGSSSLDEITPPSAKIILGVKDPLEICLELWELFSSAFRFKNDSDVMPAAFQPYFSHPVIVASLLAPPNKALFWSGVSDIIPIYQTATESFVMETSSLVEIVADLMFCGSQTSGFDYDSCIWGDFNLTGDGQWHGTWVSYWAAASMAYAPMVQGNVTILLRGDPAPYRKNSFFATCELPRLPVSNITSVQIYVAPPEDNSTNSDQCGEGSMKELLMDLMQVGINSSSITCTNNPPIIQLIDCLHTPITTQCLLM